MANPYTRFAPTQYQSQYVPAPLEQIGAVIQDASEKRQTAQLMDARTKKLVNSLGMADDPEAKNFIASLESRAMEDITQRTKRGYSSQDAIETELLAEDTAASIQSLQTAKEQRSEWEKEYREKNAHLSRNELDTRIAYYRPDIQYDQDTMRAQVQTPALEETPEDVDTVALMDKIFRGVEKQYSEVQRIQDPVTGKIRITSVGGIPKEQLQGLLASGVRNSPEAGRYLQRKKESYMMEAELAGDPEAIYDNLIETAITDEAAEETAKRIENMERNGVSPSKIYSDIKLDREINDMIGFGATKYGSRSTEIDYVTPSDQALSNTLDRINQTHAQIPKEFNNPMQMGTPTSLQGDIISLDDGKVREPNIFAKMLGVGSEERTRKPKSVAELKEKFPKNHVINQLTEEFPQRDNESQEAYLERIDGRYQDIRDEHSTYAGSFIPYQNLEQQLDERIRIIGDKNDDHFGNIRNKTISVMNDSGQLEAMNFNDFADYLGMDVNSDEFKATMDKAGLVGEYKGDNPLSPSGHYMTINVDKPGLLSGSEEKYFMIHDNDIYSNQKYKSSQELSQLRLSPVMTSKNINIGGTDFEFKKKHRYVIEDENGRRTFYAEDASPEEMSKARYLDSRLSYYDEKKDRYIMEGEEDFVKIMKGMASYGGQ